MEVITKTVDSEKDAREQLYILLGGSLVDGALSVKITELCSRLLTERGIDAKESKAVFLYTMPNGVSTGDIKAIAEGWLAMELLEKIKELKEINLYSLFKYFVNEIDKITAEIIEE